jgi:hypothetical protein
MRFLSRAATKHPAARNRPQCHRGRLPSLGADAAQTNRPLSSSTLHVRQFLAAGCRMTTPRVRAGLRHPASGGGRTAPAARSVRRTSARSARVDARLLRRVARDQRFIFAHQARRRLAFVPHQQQPAARFQNPDGIRLMRRVRIEPVRRLPCGDEVHAGGSQRGRLRASVDRLKSSFARQCLSSRPRASRDSARHRKLRIRDPETAAPAARFRIRYRPPSGRRADHTPARPAWPPPPDRSAGTARTSSTRTENLRVGS